MTSSYCSPYAEEVEGEEDGDYVLGADQGRSDSEEQNEDYGGVQLAQNSCAGPEADDSSVGMIPATVCMITTALSDYQLHDFIATPTLRQHIRRK